jgi:SAM-dependent methyltransferase
VDSEFYDRTYGSFAERLNATIRAQAFAEEIGQNSWLTADEHREFFRWLEIDGSSRVLEVACGSGGPALFMARETGCRVTGVDLHVASAACPGSPTWRASPDAAAMSFSPRSGH